MALITPELRPTGQDTPKAIYKRNLIGFVYCSIECAWLVYLTQFCLSDTVPWRRITSVPTALWAVVFALAALTGVRKRELPELNGDMDIRRSRERRRRSTWTMAMLCSLGLWLSFISFVCVTDTKNSGVLLFFPTSSFALAAFLSALKTYAR